MPDTPIDTLVIDIEAKTTNADEAIDKFAKAIGNVATSLAKVDTGKLNSVGNGIKKLGDSLRTMSSIRATSVDSVVEKINKLSGIDTSQFATVSANLHQMANGIQSLGTASANVASVGELASNISKLGNKSVQTAVTNIPQLATALNGLMTTLSNAPRVSQNVIQMTNALANLSAQGSKVGSASNSIVKGLNRASTSATKANKSFKGLASTFGTFYANCFLVIRGLKSLWSSIESTGDYLEAYNYFDVALTKIGEDWASEYEKYGYESAEDYANSFSTRLSEKLSGLSGVKLEISADGETGILTESNMKNLGLNIQEVTQYASQLASVTNSVGQVGEVSLATASAFTKLGADMSSLFNTDYSTVMNNLQSGLIGQSRALYKYGIDITNATLQTYAYELGVEKAVSEMTQAEKMQLRMIAILDQSRISWGDQANTINSLSNSIRQFKNNISEIGQVLGQLFVPIMTKVMSVVNGVTIAVKRLLTSIAGLLGIKLSLGEDIKTDDVAESIGGISDSLDDAATSAENLKKATSTLGIDELNINSPQTDTSSSSSTGSSGGLDLTGDILSAMEEYEKVWQEAYDNMVNEAEAFADRISNALEPVKKIFEDIKIGDWFAVGEDTSNLVISIFDFFAKAIDEVDWYGIATKIGEFLEGVEWTEVLSSVGDFIWEAIKASIELWTGAYDAAPIEAAIITGIALLKFTGVGSLIVNKIKEKILEKIGELTSIFTEGGLFTNIGLVFENLFSGLSLKDSLTAIFGELGTKILGIGTIIAGVVIAVTNFFSMWRDGFSWVKEAIMLVGIALAAVGAVVLGAPALVAGVVAGIVAVVTTIAVVVHDNWDEIVDVFMNLKEKAVEVFDSVVDKAKEFVKNIKEKVETIKKDVTDKFNTVKKNVKTSLEDTKKNISENFDEMKDNIAEKLGTIKEDAVEKFETLKKNVTDKVETLKNNVSTKFESMRSILASKAETIRSNVTSKFETMKSEVTTKVETLKNNVSTKFESIRITISGIVEKIKSILNGFKNAIESVINKLGDFFGFSGKGFSLSLPTDIFNSFADAVSGAINKLKDFFSYDGKSVSVSSNVTSNSSSSSSGSSYSKVTVKAYATGGFPEDGWFRASKGEYFGQFDDGTSYIANNNQITNGIAIGVKQAVAEVMSEMYAPYLAEIAKNTKETADKEMSVNIGDKEIYKASIRGSKAYGRLLIT